MNLISLDISSLYAAPAPEPSPDAHPSESLSSGFGRVFAGAAADLPHGQGFAAARQNEVPVLQAVDLGPSMRLITPASAPPDADSLVAFAKAQGLDEAAVHWLLGLPAGVAPPVVPQVISAEGFAGGPGGVVTQWMGQPQAQAAPSADDLAAMLAVARVGQWQRGLPNAPPASSNVAAAQTGTPDAGQAPIEVMLDLETDLTDFSEVLDAPDALEALRIWLAGDAGSADGSQAGTQTTAGPSLEIPGRAPGTPTVGGPDRPSPSAELMQRSEQYQALSQRLGEAMAQRLVAQAERGHWNVKFMLRPQSLGQIEVELRMRSGEMDAAFKASHVLTRELINDGLPRLRELLSQMGMNVAEFHVGSGQGQKSGGNPTLFKAPGEAVGQAAQAPAGAEAGMSPRQHQATGGVEGWDVLV